MCGLGIVGSIVDGMGNLGIVDGMGNLAGGGQEDGIVDNELTRYFTPPGHDSVRASLEFISNFEVGQAEDVGQGEAPAIPPFSQQYAKN